MSETPQIHKGAENSFLKKAAVAGAGVILLGAAGQAIINNQETTPTTDTSEEFKTSIEAANDALYTPDDVIGKFTIEEGGIEGPALNTINQVLGDAIYNDVKSLIYNAVHESASQHGIPQPGSEYIVVTTTIGSDPDGAKEYIIVEPTQIVHPEVTELPTPETH